MCVPVFARSTFPHTYDVANKLARVLHWNALFALGQRVHALFSLNNIVTSFE